MQSGYYPPNINNNYLNTNEQNNNLEFSDGILKSNIGQKVNIYMSFPDSIEWRDKVFEGNIIDVGKDFILIKTNNGQFNLLWSIYINYIEFDKAINF